jgi:hypothetical protein
MHICRRRGGTVEPSADMVRLQVLAGAEDDPDALDDLTAFLRDELLELDVASVDFVEASPPEGAKGAFAVLGGWLAVHFGPAGLREVVRAVISWAGRNGKTVELTLGGNTLKLTGASADVQSRIVDEFFARQRPAV